MCLRFNRYMDQWKSNSYAYCNSLANAYALVETLKQCIHMCVRVRASALAL